MTFRTSSREFTMNSVLAEIGYTLKRLLLFSVDRGGYILTADCEGIYITVLHFEKKNQFSAVLS